MNCHFCGEDTSVIDSRLTKDNHVRRRRECKDCGERFTTYEVTDVELEYLRQGVEAMEGLAEFMRRYRDDL